MLTRGPEARGPPRALPPRYWFLARGLAFGGCGRSRENSHGALAPKGGKAQRSPADTSGSLKTGLSFQKGKGPLL